MEAEAVLWPTGRGAGNPFLMMMNFKATLWKRVPSVRSDFRLADEKAGNNLPHRIVGRKSDFTGGSGCWSGNDRA